jgi:hypothetical protein
VVEESVPKPRLSLAWRFTVAALVVVILAAAFVIGQTLRSSPPLPVLAASYSCAPGSLIPQLKPGGSGTITTNFGGFTAHYRASIPASAPTNTANAGMPFDGTLTMSQGGQSWTLPRPDSPYRSQINALCILAFQREQYPGVMIEGFTGGAHCCEQPVIYLFNKTSNRYVKVLDMSPIDFQDPHAYDANGGFVPKVVGDRVLLRTSDGQFAYAFDCYACSALPIVLDSVGAGGLTDVTGQERALVVTDARTIWQGAQARVSTTHAPFGLLPAWVADECALGRGATAWSTMEHLTRDGELSDALYQHETLNHGSYLVTLKAFLLHNDYCVGQI